jgi:chromosome segregation ATPase
MELKAIMSDFNTLLKENQNIKQQVATLSHDVYETKILYESTVTQLQQTKEILQLKEHELLNSMEQQKDIYIQHDVLHTAATKLDVQNKDLRHHIISLQSEIHRLEHLIQQYESDLEKQHIELNSSTDRIHEYQHSIQNLQHQVHELSNEKSLLHNDINVNRDLNVGLEHTRIGLQQQVLELQHTIKQRDMSIHGISLDNGKLATSIKEHRDQIQALETIIQELRLQLQTLTAQAQHDNDTQQQSIHELQYELNHLNSQYESVCQQLTMLQTYSNTHIIELQQMFQNMIHYQQQNISSSNDTDTAEGTSTVNHNDQHIHELTNQLNELFKTSKQQLSTIQQLTTDKTKLRSFIYRYEIEIKKLETQVESYKKQNEQHQHQSHQIDVTTGVASSNEKDAVDGQHNSNG